MDFSSQEPLSEEGRVENEVISIEETIKFQKNQNANFLLIYTTILDHNSLNLNKICDESDELMLRGWPGLVIEEELINSPINVNTKKNDGIECVLIQIARKYDYNFEFAEKLSKDFDGNNILSIAAILKRT